MEVVLAYWGHHCSRVAAATANKAQDIEEDMTIEKTVDGEAGERVDYGETGSLDGNFSIQETKSLVGSMAMLADPRGSRG